MKFYEVQQALEEGKRVRRKDMLPWYYIKAIKVTYPNNSYDFFLYKCKIIDNKEISDRINYNSELFDDNWEILEDIPEVNLFHSTYIYFTCPKCLTNISLSTSKQKKLFCVEKQQDEVHECGYCGQQFKFSNFNEMKNECDDQKYKKFISTTNIKSETDISDVLKQLGFFDPTSTTNTKEFRIILPALKIDRTLKPGQCRIKNKDVYTTIIEF